MDYKEIQEVCEITKPTVLHLRLQENTMKVTSDEVLSKVYPGIMQVRI